MRFFRGYERGSELGWGRLLGGPDPYETALDTYKYVIFKNPSWDWRTFSLERDFAEAIRVTQGLLTAVDPNLTPFAARGGKLLTYHGWADESIPPRASINFYTRTLRRPRRPLPRTPTGFGCSWCRACSTAVAALDRIRSMRSARSSRGSNAGQAPASILASHSTAGRVDRTRPLCPYPQVAKYRGTGSIDDAANFACVSAQGR